MAGAPLDMVPLIVVLSGLVRILEVVGPLAGWHCKAGVVPSVVTFCSLREENHVLSSISF